MRVKNTTEQSLSGLRADFERLKSQMTPEVQALVSLLFSLFEVLISSMGKRANSSTSHMPPSQDPFRAKKKRPKGKRPKGGQPGHKGSTLAMAVAPDKTVQHPAKKCDACGTSLKKVPVEYVSRHQVIDIIFKKVVVEHRVEHKNCACGNHQAHALAQGNAPVQYGPGLKACAVELNQIQCLPFKRCAQFFREKYFLTLSPGTLVKFARQASIRLRLWEQEARANLIASPLVHADETGINVDGVLWWVHVVSNEHTVLMTAHRRRGTEAMVEADVLTNYTGMVCHDFWASYGTFDVIHVACNAHLQRELEKVLEDHGQKWAGEMAGLLARANEERDQHQGDLPYERIQYYEEQYTRLLGKGDKANPRQMKRVGKSRGRIAQTYPRRLLERMRDCRSWIVLFLYDPSVPFTNNQAERDIRMLKVHQKVSGCFRSDEGARDHCLLRSYILTMQRRNVSYHQALSMLFEGT